jgi:hypothetical protein
MYSAIPALLPSAPVASAVVPFFVFAAVKAKLVATILQIALEPVDLRVGKFELDKQIFYFSH